MPTGSSKLGPHDAAKRHMESGRALRAMGRLDDALVSFVQAARLDPTQAEAWKELSAAYDANGDSLACDRAYEHFEQWVSPHPALTEVDRALARGEASFAVEILSRRISAEPSDVAALRMRAEIAARHENLAESEQLLVECLKYAPGFSRARFDLVQILHLQQNASPSIPLIERLLAFDPANLRYRTARAGAYSLLGDGARAVQEMSELVSDSPGHVMLWLYYGHALRTAGRISEAIGAYRQCIALDPRFCDAWFSIANAKTSRFETQDIEAMQALLSDASLGSQDRMQLEFALAKAFEDQRQFGASYAHYHRGNAIRRSQIHYDGDAFTRLVERSERLFTTEFFRSRVGWGNPSKRPIFVVGLPRSGSTLIEQVLGGHSKVDVRGERPEIIGIAIDTCSDMTKEYPDALRDLSKDDVWTLSEQYLSRADWGVAADSAQVDFFVDKMPANFVHLGLIHLMFPNARIIDARRHPMGCAVSCFKQLFPRAQKFSYDLGELARYYRDYRRLMGHFATVLPGRVHEVCYEALVAHPRDELMRMLNYCGVPFEDGCLRFDTSNRVVHTLSAEQVRRPIYDDSVRHWRNFEPWLGTLQKELGALIENYPVVSPDQYASSSQLNDAASLLPRRCI